MDVTWETISLMMIYDGTEEMNRINPDQSPSVQLRSIINVIARMNEKFALITKGDLSQEILVERLNLINILAEKAKELTVVGSYKKEIDLYVADLRSNISGDSIKEVSAPRM